MLQIIVSDKPIKHQHIFLPNIITKFCKSAISTLLFSPSPYAIIFIKIKHCHQEDSVPTIGGKIVVMPEKTSSKKVIICILAVLCLAVVLTIVFISFRTVYLDNSDKSDSMTESEMDLSPISSVHFFEFENIKMASATVSLANGSKVSVELIMTNGKYYDEYWEDYLPSIYTYSQNFEGTYELHTVNEYGDILFRIDLKDLWTDTNNTFNFPGEFELEWTDYNSDGCPDFSIGMPYSSSNMGFLLFTVREDGSLERLSSNEIILNSFEKFSVIFDHDTETEGMPITGYMYNNTVGEVESVIYYYNEDNRLYEEQ